MRALRRHQSFAQGQIPRRPHPVHSHLRANRELYRPESLQRGNQSLDIANEGVQYSHPPMWLVPIPSLLDSRSKRYRTGHGGG